mgnify:CR=1 FL=1
MELFLQHVLNGMTLGSIYALIALGYSIVYGILKMINFAKNQQVVICLSGRGDKDLATYMKAME